VDGEAVAGEVEEEVFAVAEMEWIVSPGRSEAMAERPREERGCPSTGF
jgi:hypothetical protein